MVTDGWLGFLYCLLLCVRMCLEAPLDRVERREGVQAGELQVVVDVLELLKVVFLQDNETFQLLIVSSCAVQAVHNMFTILASMKGLKKNRVIKYLHKKQRWVGEYIKSAPPPQKKSIVQNCLICIFLIYVEWYDLHITKKTKI